MYDLQSQNVTHRTLSQHLRGVSQFTLLGTKLFWKKVPSHRFEIHIIHLCSGWTAWKDHLDDEPTEGKQQDVAKDWTQEESERILQDEFGPAQDVPEWPDVILQDEHGPAQDVPEWHPVILQDEHVNGRTLLTTPGES